MIAHSYGSYVALKLAEILESNGKSGHISFIDGSPLLIKTLTLEHYKVKTDEAIQNSIVGHLLSNIFTTLDDDFVRDVFSQQTWNEKIHKLVHYSEVHNFYKKDYLKLMLIALVNRIKIILNTDVKISSISKCTSTLIRPNTASLSNVCENYDLDINFKETKTNIIFLDGNHFTILENPSLLEIITESHKNIGK